MGEPALASLPNRDQILLRLEGARRQAELAATALAAGDRAGLESAVCATIDQALKAVTAALYGLNVLLPSPLPASRLTRRNLRDRFAAVSASSAVLELLDREATPLVGWLWWLDRKEAASAFASLLCPGEEAADPPTLWRDPLEPSHGIEALPPDRYLAEAVAQVERLLEEIGQLVGTDVETYREAARRQFGRLI
jgi:hypothetical protein